MVPSSHARNFCAKSLSAICATIRVSSAPCSLRIYQMGMS